jgi:hypothetical protein
MVVSFFRVGIDAKKPNRRATPATIGTAIHVRGFGVKFFVVFFSWDFVCFSLSDGNDGGADRFVLDADGVGCLGLTGGAVVLPLFLGVCWCGSCGSGTGGGSSFSLRFAGCFDDNGLTTSGARKSSKSFADTVIQHASPIYQT